MKDDDFKLLRGFADKQTNRQTFVNVELLSRLKIQVILSEVCNTFDTPVRIIILYEILLIYDSFY